MNKLENILILKNPIEVKKILNSHKKGLFDKNEEIKTISISILQSYQDKRSYNMTLLYSAGLVSGDGNNIEKHIVGSSSSHYDKKYTYLAGCFVFNGTKNITEVKIPQEYLYIKDYNLVLREYLPGSTLTKVVTEKSEIDQNYLEYLMKWLASFQKIKPDSKIKRGLGFNKLDVNIKILEQRNSPKASDLRKEFDGMLDAIAKWSKEYNTVPVHGDFNPSNILIHQDKISVIDFEDIHCGDRFVDVANLSTYMKKLSGHKNPRREADKKVEEIILKTYEKYTKKTSDKERVRMNLYNKYFERLFETHEMIWNG